tara:strand:- start:2522 stop:3121 length:600 start_codon:yes stop_codon:yes gene_type:complete
MIFLYLCFVSYVFLAFALLLIAFLTLNEFNYIFSKILNKNKFLNLVVIFMILCYIVYFIVSIWLFLVPDISENRNVLLFLIIICISTDVGGYVFGKFFKGKKITKISPNKTYAGVIGSFFLSLFVSVIFFSDVNLKINIYLFTIIISSISQLGDLFVSFLKRKAKIKDTGNFLPGHGGLLDRIDGILFTIPIGIILISF